MNEKQKLLRQIQMCDFAITDVVLYLDGHPNCSPALAYYEKQKQMRRKLVYEFNEKYGPLNVCQNQDPNRWHWVDGPWPWEMEA